MIISLDEYKLSYQTLNSGIKEKHEHINIFI